jgi:hypothetical protein
VNSKGVVEMKSGNLKRGLNLMLAALLPAIALGCAKATITPHETAPASSAAVGVAQTRPNRIVVYDFEVYETDVTENQGPLQKAYRAVAKNQEQLDADRLKIGQEAAHDLSEDLVKQLTALGFQVDNLPRGTAAGPNDLVVDGEFLTADEGNKARRMIIGFGAGASKLETQVRVSRVSDSGTPAQIMRFKTASDSGKMPGAALTMGAGAAAQGGAAVAGAGTAVQSAGKVYNSMLSTLADKTSKQITAYLSQYFGQQGWIAQDKVQTAATTE